MKNKVGKKTRVIYCKDETGGGQNDLMVSLNKTM